MVRPPQRDLLLAFRDLAAGRGVKRGRHSLVVDGTDRTDLFFQALAEERFEPTTVRSASVAPGEKAPAFLVRDGKADFGWVFWEKFTASRLRKLFGSVVRNAKGDWAIQIGVGNSQVIYVNVKRRASTDLDHPPSI